MPTPAALVEAHLLPELAALRAVDPASADERVRRMSVDAGAFLRGSLRLHGHWVLAECGIVGPWVWAVGDAHQANFATLANGPVNRHGVVPVIYGISDVDDELPAPWRWDALRLLTSLAVARPGLRPADLGILCATFLAHYVRTLERLAEDDALALRIDRTGLPEALQNLIDHDSDPEYRARRVARHIDDGGPRPRLRLGPGLVADQTTAAWLPAALEQLWGGMADLPKVRVLDVARRLSSGGISSVGRRRWLALIREQVRGERHLRVIEVKERPPSALATLLTVSPFAPPAGRRVPLTLAMGGDPYQGVLCTAPATFLVRTRCHTRSTLDLAALDGGDLRRLAELWGQLLADFHVRGLRALGEATPAHLTALANDATAARKVLPAQARALAAFNARAMTAFLKAAPGMARERRAAR
jgi:hypothetical protein